MKDFYRLSYFILVSLMAIGMITCRLMIRPSDINHELARGGIAEDAAGQDKPSGFATVMADRRLLIFALCVFLCHFFGNAAMLPPVGQKLSLGGDAGEGIAFTSACIVAAQGMMAIMAIICGRTADSWGRKPLFLFACAILPLRAILDTFTNNSVALVAIQSLDGVANGIFAIIFLLVVSDVTSGTGRFNVVQGALATLVGIGATLSNLMAEWLV